MEKDTAVKYLPAVEVTAVRPISNSAIEFTPHKLIGLEYINSLSPVQISDILNLSPGIYISDYGGLSGLKTVSIRGTGSSRTLVLLDGMPISSTQNSSFDLGDFSPSLLDDIEIVRGGSSAIFGGNAVGGVVNLRTNFRPKDLFRVDLSLGSFSERALGLGANVLFDNSYLSASFDYLSSEGDFPFTYNQFGKETEFRRVNSDYERLSFSVSGNASFSKWNFWARAIYSETEKGVPGAILQGKIADCTDRLSDDKFLFVLNSSRIFSPTSSLLISAISRFDNSCYQEPAKTSQTDSYFNLKDMGISGKYNSLFYGINNEFLFSTFFSHLTGNMLDPVSDSSVFRHTLGIAYRLEKSFNFLDLHNIDFSLGGRFDYISDTETAFSYLCGLMYGISDFPVRLKSTLSYNFRPPNFNEMYYRNYGTIDLRSERSNNFNFGISSNIFNYLSFDVDVFFISTRDMIVSVPKTPVSWSATNLDNVNSKGLEISLFLNNPFLFIENFSLSYTLQKTLDNTSGSITYGKQLVYTPQEQITLMLETSFYEIHLGGKMDYSSFRYVQPDNDSRYILPSYLTFDAYVYKQLALFGADFTLRLSCRNLFNEHYSLVSNYPMPGRSFRLSLSMRI